MVDVGDLFETEIGEHARVVTAMRAAARSNFIRLVHTSVEAIRKNKKLVLFGNGGSAADAQHLAAELAVRYRADRPPIAALALTTDSSVLTAAGNDLGFSQIFARQVEALCQAGDVCIGLSTSGQSDNVIEGLATARAKECITAAFTGGDGGRLHAVADPLIIVPSASTARIQEMHILIGHLWCHAIERALGFE